jgi:hypothetical protein
VQYAGTTERGEPVGGSSGSSEFSTSGGSTEMVSYGCSYTNRKILIKGVGENLLSTAHAWWLGWPGLSVAAPSAGNRHTDLFCNLIPGQPWSRSSKICWVEAG